MWEREEGDGGQREVILDKKDAPWMPHNTSGGFVPRATHAPVPTATTGPTTGSSRLGSRNGVREEEGKEQAVGCREGGGWGGGPFSAPSPLTFISDRLLFHVPTPTPTPTFHLVKKPVGWAGVGPGEGPVIQVWGQEGTCERNQLGAPTPGLSSHSSLP